MRLSRNCDPNKRNERGIGRVSVVEDESKRMLASNVLSDRDRAFKRDQRCNSGFGLVRFRPGFPEIFMGTKERVRWHFVSSCARCTLVSVVIQIGHRDVEKGDKRREKLR